MNRSRKTTIAVIACIFFSTPSNARCHLIDVIPCLGAASIVYWAPFAYKSEQEIVSELVEELQNNIEKRRSMVCTTIGRLQKNLHMLEVTMQKCGGDRSEEKSKIITSLNTAHEELRTIDLDYQIEYVRIRPRARYLKEYSIGGVIGGALFIFLSALGHH